ncbi:MAG TPA: helix-turn-helix transcriptional regulator [Thermoanaerobaculia bacterium]|nr:helix-turn-helix transcriptional regulator [Thermoanaerobaculia bacterium]
MVRKKEQSLAADFGARLRSAREHNEWNQKELADRLEVTAPQVCRWESGKILPNTETQIDICDLFGAPMDLFVRGIGTVRGEVPVDAELRELTAIIERLPIHYRNEAREMQRSIIAKARQDGVTRPTASAEADAATPKAARR